MTAEANKQLSTEELIREIMTRDFAAQALGIKLLGAGEGYSKLSMLVRRDMLNGLAVCHGGMIFSLADTAFAYACNSRNRRTLALQCSINFIDSAMEGDVLIAEAEERSLKGRTGVYDIKVLKENGQLIAE